MENQVKIIRGESTTGYVIIDGSNTLKIERVDLYKGRNVLKLPENSSNRKYQDEGKLVEILEKEGEMVLEYKPTRVLTGGNSHKKPTDYLEGEDKELFLKLLEKAKILKEESMKPKTEKEKLEAKIKAQKEKIEKLQKLLEEIE